MVGRPDSVLYFPSIEFRDENWLKHSLLLWDRVYRIVPGDYVPDDTADVLRAADADFLRNILPDADDLSETADSFLAFVDEQGVLPAGLIDTELDRLHPDKIDRRLYPLLSELAERFDDGWLHLPPGLTRAYMFFLSGAMARRRRLTRGTDDADSWTVDSFFVAGGNFDEFVQYPAAEGYYCSMIVEDLFPIDLTDTPMKEILKVAEENADLRRAFRQEVSSIADDLAICESAEFVRQMISDRKANFEQLKQEYKKSMSFANVDDLRSSLTVGLPVALTALGLLAANPFTLIGLWQSVLLGGVAALADYTHAKHRSRGGNQLGSYLIELDRKLAKTRSHPSFERIFEEFVND